MCEACRKQRPLPGSLEQLRSPDGVLLASAEVAWLDRQHAEAQTREGRREGVTSELSAGDPPTQDHPGGNPPEARSSGKASRPITVSSISTDEVNAVHAEEAHDGHS